MFGAFRKREKVGSGFDSFTFEPFAAKLLDMKRFLLFIFLISALFVSCNFFGSDDDDDSSPSLSKTTSDWLILGYFDADNNLESDLKRDINKELKGLSALGSSPNVRVVALWDGEESSAGIYDISSSGYTDITSYASGWLPAEPDMGDVSTLTGFLCWTAKYFSASNVVLLLSDHGAGTEYETVSGGSVNARSLCSDDTNASGLLLTATDVKSAISYSGLSVNVIWMDCCLQGNVETAYILRGSANYLVSSANSSYSNNHYAIFSDSASFSSPLSFAKSVVNAYADSLCEYNMEAQSRRASFDSALTQAVYSLSSSAQNTLESAIETLSSALLSEGKTVCNSVFSEYLLQTPFSVSTCKGMGFVGTYTYLCDIGYFCYELINGDIVTDTTKSAAKNVVSALESVIPCSFIGRKGTGTFNNSTGKYTTQTNIYYERNMSRADTTVLSSSDGVFGLTILTQPYSYSNLATNYEANTGYSSKWGELLSLWN